MMTYKGVQLTISEDELNSFIAKEKNKIKYSIHSFDETFNGTVIKNPTNDISAKYYVLSYGDKTFLQNHIPFAGGYLPILHENAEDVIAEHIENIIDNEILNKFTEK